MGPMEPLEGEHCSGGYQPYPELAQVKLILPHSAGASVTGGSRDRDPQAQCNPGKMQKKFGSCGRT